MAAALEQQWAITAQDKAVVVARLMEIVRNPESRPRSIIAASNALANVARTNLAAIETALKCEAQQDIDVRLREIEGRLPRHAVPSEA
jgi:hypothetical protein